ncbi:MAG: ribosome-binding factor A [Candidatus Glassbacteria bacterium RBG_16_58_8]|uniref:Ribosome-binding factor A n=1 Tax=Candidatus Glassbacteria bacterium RBG_16_58_8 TaxID=1817866 RepID=A0A1F5YD87_9BACT|nr:MAG: ribosome-binding factor A [Candidatus Glassbacteria bacterium RBG_16_58_8]
MRFGYSRSDRVSELILQEVSWIIRNGVKDPRIGFVTVTAVELSPDLRHARIYCSVMGNEEEKIRSWRVLNRAKGYIRSSFGHRVRLKYLPEFVFVLDRSLERVQRIDELLRGLSEKKDRQEEG